MSMKNYGVEGYGVNLCDLQFKENKYNYEHSNYDFEAMDELLEKLSKDSVYLDYETACGREAIYLMFCPTYPWYLSKEHPQTQEEVNQLIWKTLKDYIVMSMEVDCGWLGLDSESAHCPKCGRNDCIMDLDGTEEWYLQEQLKELWQIFGDLPMNPETEKIEEVFLCYPAGTHREEIWHWFDKRYDGGVVKLMGVI